MNKLPVFRPVRAAVSEDNGHRMVTFHDPANFVETPLTVSLPAYFLMSLMDGTRGVEALCAEFESQFGQNPGAENVTGLIKSLDEALLLDNERYHSRKIEEDNWYGSLETRPAVFAGVSYPADQAELGGALDSLLKSAATSDSANGVKAVIAPHIDFRVGADMMAQAWVKAAKSGADLYIILGIGHTMTEDFFACFGKDYDTPLGPMRVDREFLAALELNFGESVFKNAAAHRYEHSIEFASLFMAHIFKRKPEVTAVPILLSFHETYLKMDHPVFGGERISKFIAALKKTAEECGRKVCFVASVDFAHVGARFGDSHALDDSELGRIQKDDNTLMNAISSMDTHGFLKEIERVNCGNRICGFPAIYTMMSVCGAERGKVLSYRQNIEGERENVVSFASMILSG